MTVLGRVRDVLMMAGVIYVFPLAILAIFIPLAFAINGLLIAAEWTWRSLF